MNSYKLISDKIPAVNIKMGNKGKCKKYKAKISTIIPLLLATLIILNQYMFYFSYADDENESDDFNEIRKMINESNNDTAEPCITKIPSIDAHSAIVMDMESGRVLFEKNAYSKRPMASTTKIMTAIVAIENGKLDDIVEVSEKAASIWGSKIHLKKGQKISLKELLYGLMLRSGNDAAIAIAEHIGGSEEKFLQMMNDKARQIGALNTNFKTPHGLDEEEHYTTAYDLALITRYALQNPLFSTIVSTRNAYVNGRSVNNTNEMLSVYKGADGVKTGFTGKAGRCLVTSATRQGVRYISVVLNCPTRAKRAMSSKLILDYAFNNYTRHVLAAKDEIVAEVNVIKGMEDKVKIKTCNSLILPLTQGEITELKENIYIPQQLRAPVAKGQIIGRIEYVSQGKILGSVFLETQNEVNNKDFIYYIKNIFMIWLRTIKEGIFIENA